MAEDTEEKELNLDESGDATAESSRKSSKKIILIAAVALLAAAGGGAYFFLGGETESEDDMLEAEVETPVEEAFYIQLEPAFVINLPDRGKQRFLQASVTLMSRDSATLIKIERHMPVIRHHLTNVLSAQTISSIQSPGGIEQVRSQALDQINTVLTQEYEGASIEQVLFTAFVMQ